MAWSGLLGCKVPLPATVHSMVSCCCPRLKVWALPPQHLPCLPSQPSGCSNVSFPSRAAWGLHPFRLVLAPLNVLWGLLSPLLEAGGRACPGLQPGTARHPKRGAGGPSAQWFSVATPEVWQGGRGCRKPGGRVSEPYLNLLMFFSDTRMKSTMG